MFNVINMGLFVKSDLIDYFKKKEGFFMKKSMKILF